MVPLLLLSLAAPVRAAGLETLKSASFAFERPAGLDAALFAAGTDPKNPIIADGKPADAVVRSATPPGAPLGRVDLEALRDRLWVTALTVELGGRTFHLSGMQARTGGYYVTLLDAREKKVRFFEKRRLALGGYDLEVEGRRYHIGVAANLADLYASRLRVRDVAARRDPLDVAVRDVMRAMYEAGEEVVWDGKRMRVHYNTQIYEEKGRVRFDAKNPLLVFMIEQPDREGEDKFMGDAVPGPTIPRVESDAEAWLHANFRIRPHGAFRLHLRRADGGRTLEVHSAP